MPEASFLLSVLAVTAPLSAALVLRDRLNPRGVSVAAVVFAMVCCGAAIIFPPSGGQWFALDELSAFPAVVIAALLMAILIAAPPRDIQPAACRRMLVAFAGVLIVYAAGNAVVLLAGWTLSAAPFLTRHAGTQRERSRWFARPAVALGISVALVCFAVVLLSTGADDFRVKIAVTLLVLASLIRSGLFPFHSWVVASFESDALLPYAWLLGARTGAMVLAKLAVLAPTEANGALVSMMNDLALFSSVLMAVVAMGENVPRRVLGFVVVSQSGFIISGLQGGNVEGVTGALLQWIVVSVSAVALAVLLRCLEERYSSLEQHSFAGLGTRAPRMAVLFLLFSLALVGFPGTLGFLAEDLLFHDALSAHPILGLALPITTSLLAIRLFNLFSRIFLGRRGIHVPPVRDALPRERWVLTALVALLVIAGLAPQSLIDSRARAARAIASANGHGESTARR